MGYRVHIPAKMNNQFAKLGAFLENLAKYIAATKFAPKNDLVPSLAEKWYRDGSQNTKLCRGIEHLVETFKLLTISA